MYVRMYICTNEILVVENQLGKSSKKNRCKKDVLGQWCSNLVNSKKLK